MYDEAIHKAGSQVVVEKPSLYIIGRSGSSVADQIEFSSYRLEDLRKLESIYIPQLDVTVTFIPRFCVVDSPARSFECGTQLGGTYRCPCGLNCDQFSYLPKALLSSHRSLSDVQSKVLAGSLWKSNGPTPFKTIKKYQLEQELDARGINPCGTSYHTAHRSDLDAVLTEELKGILRLPAIIISQPEASLQSLGCHMYEVPHMEVMHDMCNMVNHIMLELPFYSKSQKLTDFVQYLRNDHQKFRAIDARRYCVRLCVFAQQLLDAGEISRSCLRLLQVLTEIIQIGYSQSDKRTQKSILRFHNLTFLLAMFMKEEIGDSP